MNYDRKIQHILENFDFDSVHHVMNLLNWQWQTKGVPSIEDLKDKADELLTDCAIKQDVYRASGGFVARYYEKDDSLQLEFVIESWDSSTI